MSLISSHVTMFLLYDLYQYRTQEAFKKRIQRCRLAKDLQARYEPVFPTDCEK